ncbi:MAG: TonB-dependent receptor plug domain-containing protein [Crocinitomicaceae bacterium]
MKILELKLIALTLIMSTLGFSQEIIRGEVKDVKTGEPVFNATVKLDGVGKAKTDFDGAFSIKTTAGEHKLLVTNPTEGYIDEEVLVEVVAGRVMNVVIEIGKDKSVQKFEDIKVVVVKTTGPPTTLEGSDKRRMEETATSDEMPKEQIRNSGVTNAADAVQMVPAASVEDGKNVYIRGLGDRYTKTILNGMDIPGLDPDRNSVQMDIFPAVMIDNITVYKTFTPNLTADFTGGLVNIQTKDFPGRKTLYAKGGLGYNVNATFNPDFIGYEGGALDFLGFDDGTRGLPVNPSTEIPHPSQGDDLTENLTRRFGQTMSTQKAFSFMNQNHAFAYGNQINKPMRKDSLKKWSYGYNVVMNYRTNNNYYDDVEYNEFIRDTDLNETELFRDRTSRGQLSVKDVMWTALLGQSIKFNRNKISLVMFHTQNGTMTTALLNETNYDSNQAQLVKHGLQYSQRSISNVNLNGTHFLDSAGRFKMTWALSPTLSRISDPDIRSTALELADYSTPENPIYLWEESVGAEVRRIFRSLNEINISAKVDFENKFKLGEERDWTLKYGGLNTYKTRSFDVSEYVFRLYGMSNEVPNDPDWFFQPENIYTTESGQGTYATGQQEKANIYDATQNITAGYVMGEIPVTNAFNVTAGARVEKNINRYTGQSNNADFDPNAPRYENEVVLDQLNVLPSLNLVYKIRKEKDSLLKNNKSTNFRGAYTQTVARPSFREISISQIYDPIQGRRYLGNIDLKQTLIHNADLRWEHFFGRTELISASAFYKKFINPIEIVANVAAPNELKPVNAGEANVYGAEIELRKAIGFVNSPDKSLLAGANFTYVVSQIDMTKVDVTVGDSVISEYAVRQANARTGETVDQFRPMFGQSPYIVNAYLTFKHDSLNLMFNVSYNVQGKKLAVIGVGNLPDVYEQPFHSLNLKVSKGFGKIHKGEDAPRWQASFRAQNLLNNARRRYYEAYEAEPQVYDYLNQGMTFSASVTYTIR